MTAPARRAPGGPSFWIGLAIGVPVMAFGAGWALGHPGKGKPLELAKWLLAADVLHDAVVAPTACLIGVLVVARLPAVVRAPARAGLFASAVALAVGYPVLRGYGRNPTNPSELPLDYTTAVATAIGVAWAFAALWCVLAVLAARARKHSVSLAVIAKAPRPGESKTRLCPPCTPDEAADVARAALEDTLAVVLETPVGGDRVAVLDDDAGSWLPGGFTVVRQREGGLGDRLAGAFEDIGGPLLVIAMDTPQVTPDLLAGAARALDQAGTDAVIGLTDDGGYWAIGLRQPDPRVFEHVPMSTPRTGRIQLARMRDLHLNTELLPPLRDVDTFADALAVASETPDSQFAAAVRDVTASRVDRPHR